MSQKDGAIDGFLSEEIIFEKILRVLDKMNHDPKLKGEELLQNL